MTTSHLKLALSPCPNDSYMFFAWLAGLLAAPHPEVKPFIAGIAELNAAVLAGTADVSKVSFLTMAQSLSAYTLLPVGCALGYGVGPKLVTSNPKLRLKDLSRGNTLIPGLGTTAYLLLRLLFPSCGQITSCSFAAIPQRLAAKEADFGVIIHESRFHLQDYGLYELADLGALWWQRYHLPVPLGCLVARRSLGDPLINAVCQAVVDSLSLAARNPPGLKAALTAHSHEKDLAAAEGHVKLYINGDSKGLTPSGREAFGHLLKKAADGGFIPPPPAHWLFPWQA